MKKQSDQKRVKEIIKILSKEIPDSTIALKFSNPFELLIATILSAQCTDVKVNQVTVGLFKKYRSARDYAESNLLKLEEEIRPTGFYRNKAKSIQKCCQDLVNRFGGEVPRILEDLVTLPGVGRKTANVTTETAPAMQYFRYCFFISPQLSRLIGDCGLKSVASFPEP